jgi:hypothetical protein
MLDTIGPLAQSFLIGCPKKKLELPYSIIVNLGQIKWNLIICSQLIQPSYFQSIAQKENKNKNGHN